LVEINQLFCSFGSLDRIRTLSADELAQIVPRPLAARIADYLRAVPSKADSL
jgi:hypothetical protein